jgi:hypothetical protein
MSLLKTAGIQHPSVATQSITIDGTTGAVTFPNGGPATLTGAETLSNKTLASPTFTGQVTGLELAFSQGIVFEGTTADSSELTLSAGEPTADRVVTLPDATGTVALTSDLSLFITAASTSSLTNKSIDLATNTVTGTIAQFNSAVSDANLATIDGSETLINKTLTTPTLNDPKINLAFDSQTGSTYTVVLNDNGQVVTMDNASANTLSIPTNASVNYPVGTQINILQIGVGQTTIQAVTSGTTTILSTAATPAAPKIRARYGMATCIKAGTDLWYVIGDIA